MQGSEVIIRIQGRPVGDRIRRPVNAEGHIILTGIHQFDGGVHLLGDEGRFHQVMRVGSAAETAAHTRQFNFDFFFRHAEPGRQGLFDKFRRLQRSGDLGFIGGHMGEEIHRLHAVVGQERR